MAEYRGKCRAHTRKADQLRGTSAERGYQSARWHGARKTVLRRDPICTCDGGIECHGTEECQTLSTVADHYPESRRQLLGRGVLDPDDPSLLRGICALCHNKSTARDQPGGWAAT